MKQGKQLTTGKRILRNLGWMILAGLAGGIVGYTTASFDFRGLPNGIPADSIPLVYEACFDFTQYPNSLFSMAG